MITVTADTRRLQLELRALGAKAPLAASRALNRSAATVQTAAVRAIAADLPIAQKDIRKGMRLERATPRELVARLVIAGKRLALYAFRPRPSKPGFTRAAGVSYDLGRGRQLAAGTFIAKTRSGHIGVFRRRAGGRLPIIELFGPSLPRVFMAATIAAARLRLAKDALEKNLRHEVAFLGRRAA